MRSKGSLVPGSVSTSTLPESSPAHEPLGSLGKQGPLRQRASRARICAAPSAHCASRPMIQHLGAKPDNVEPPGSPTMSTRDSGRLKATPKHASTRTSQRSFGELGQANRHLSETPAV